MNLIKILLEFSAFCLGNGTCSYVAHLVVAVNEAFAMDVPAGAHEGAWGDWSSIFLQNLVSSLCFPSSEIR